MPMTIECKLSWVPCQNGAFPSNAVRIDQHAVVVRAMHDGRWIPGKGVHGHGVAYVPYGGNEIGKKDYEVLTLSACREGHECYHWVETTQGQLPFGALIAGVDGDGESLYVAKGVINGEVCGGKLKVSHRCGYLPWGGKEHQVQNCSVLCFRM